MDLFEPEKYRKLEEQIIQLTKRFHITRDDVLMASFDVAKDVVSVKIQRELKEKEI